VKNRLWQLRQALPVNLKNNWRHRQWVRFHIVDFGSTDGAIDFIRESCQEAIEAGLLHLHTASLEGFHASVAKNTAHLVASQDILINLDCDNLVDEAFAPYVRRRFEEEGLRGLTFNGGVGTCGRICCLQSDFRHLGGYDEDLHPFGAQDLDLVERLRRTFGSNLVPRSHDMKVAAVPNTKADTMRLVAGSGLSWGQMDAANRGIIATRTAAGQFIRNCGRQLGVPVSRLLPPPSPPPEESDEVCDV